MVLMVSDLSCMISAPCHADARSIALEQAAVKAAAPIGTLIGQLLFGWLADRIGRKRMCTCISFTTVLGQHALTYLTPSDGIELIIIIIGTFGQSLAANSDVHTVNIFSALIVWRIIVSTHFQTDTCS